MTSGNPKVDIELKKEKGCWQGKLSYKQSLLWMKHLPYRIKELERRVRQILQ
jgi:hypothetical protein